MAEGTPKDKVPPPPEWVPTLLDAWINTKTEADRTLLSLSAGGVALLVGLLVVVAEQGQSLWPYGLALSFFMLAIVAGLRVLFLNGNILEETLEDMYAAGQGRTKRALTTWSLALPILFALGVLASAWVGYNAATADTVSTTPQSVPVQEAP
jgi:di/tricarboxylate transporter